MEYGHGGDIYTYKGMLDFSVNVNPFGPSEAVLEAAKRGIDKCCAYPDSQCRALRTALAAKLGVPQEYILPGNGAADLFFSLVWRQNWVSRRNISCRETGRRICSSLL